MRILFINRPKSEYLQELVYTGLCKLIGAENVIESPWNDRLHLNFRPYPKNLGQVPGTLLGSVQAQLRRRKFDAVIVASCHPYTVGRYRELMRDIPANVPVIFMDGGDWPDVAGDLRRVGGREIYDEVVADRPFDLVFKREYLEEQQYPSNVIPLPMAFCYDHLPTLDGLFKYDVAFWAVESDPIRTTALDLLSDKFDCAENGTVRNQVMKRYKRKGHVYLQELARCKVGLNFRGAGWDTLRYWELAGLGRFMISQRPRIVIENDYKDGKEVVHCQDDLSDLLDLCAYYLRHEEERETIAKRAAAHTREFHTDVARARTVLKHLARLVG